MTTSPICLITVGGVTGNVKRRCIGEAYLALGARELDHQIELAVDAGYTSVIVDSWFGFEDGKHKPIDARRQATEANRFGRFGPFGKILNMSALNRVLEDWTVKRGIEVIGYPGKLMGNPRMERLKAQGRLDDWMREFEFNMYPWLNSPCSIAFDAAYGNGPNDPVTHAMGLLRSLGRKVYTEPWPAPHTPEPPGGDLPAFCLMSLYDSYRSRIGKPEFPQYIRPPVGAEGFVVVPIIDGDFDTAKRQARRIRKDGFGVAMTTWRVKAEDITQEVTR